MIVYNVSICSLYMQEIKIECDLGTLYNGKHFKRVA